MKAGRIGRLGRRLLRRPAHREPEPSTRIAPDLSAVVTTPRWVAEMAEPVTTTRPIDPHSDMVSVVIPSYNHGRFVAHAIRSVAHQTYRNIEIVVVDDGSTDDSAKVIERTLNESDWAKATFVRQDNAGAHNALNRALELCSGRYIGILNSDDAYHPQRIERLHGVCATGGFPFAFSQIAFSELAVPPSDGIDHGAEQYQIWHDQLSRYPSLGFSLVRLNGTWTSSNFFFTRDLLDRIGAFRDFVLVNDWDFVLRAVVDSEPALLAEQLLYYRRHENNTYVREGTVEAAHREFSRVLASYFESVRYGVTGNPLAPSQANWPDYFPSFLAADSQLALHPAFDSLIDIWKSTDRAPAEPPERVPT
ncbi:glycosyltransferase [Skermania sp. ID1734]|uniref:glycosyltransferase family 2 protein n=1 Tax=Skermania sp. ID1734 TaxID=2597516 RepID=UPI00117EA749|nr:glycosyltransferase [Skermania sp. ID1734]TSD93134.1 glycosyltransferase [Skermania sp. ID1734]